MLVLVVDDNAPLCATIADYLRNCGHEVHDATDAQQALAIASQLGPSLQAVVTDIEMPSMNGITMWQQMCQLVSPNCKVLFMTGNDNNNTANDLPGTVLVKPFELSELRRKLAQLSEPSAPTA